MSFVSNDYEYFDRTFRDLTVPTAKVEMLHDGCLWAEGPVWFADGGYLVWSDIPNNRMLRWMPGCRRQRLPRRLQLLQRQHARPRRPARYLRARRAPGDAHRSGRHDHGRGRPATRASG